MNEQSPQMVRALAATKQFWDEIGKEFGLLTLSVFSSRIQADPAEITQRHAARKILMVSLQGFSYFPGFQLDSADKVRPVIPELLQIASGLKSDDNDVAMWLCCRTGYLNGRRPVDFFDEPAKIVTAARNAWGVEW
jgi:hypothetical protein